VERIARLTAQGHEAWLAARAERSFARFAPILAELVDASRERASAIDPSRPTYDVLVDEFEPGMTAAALAPLFSRLRAGLVELIDAIRGAPSLPALSGTFPADAQLALCRELAGALGYDLGAGRIDLSTHPFTICIGTGDVRITTRIDPNDLLMAVGGTMHEVGHAMYEQGLPRHLLGTGLEGAASMGLHESQSRFWENTIGGSLPFCRWLEGPLRARFGEAAPDARALFQATNRVEPGPNRVMADEVTYNLHVIVRFDLERALFDGTIAVRDLREAWNEAYRRDLGVDPADDVQGVLQDIHWSGAAFGYFPTYTLGNLYAASLGAKLAEDLPALWDLVERGEFAPILGWLRERVHRHGQRWETAELVERVVGRRDPVEDLLAHVWGRHGAIHGVRRNATSSPS
jgi:carboxypeptidase Taq